MKTVYISRTTGRYVSKVKSLRVRAGNQFN